MGRNKQAATVMALTEDMQILANRIRERVKKVLNAYLGHRLESEKIQAIRDEIFRPTSVSSLFL